MTGFKINYYLQKINKEKSYSFILISISWNKQRIRTTIKIQVDEKFWDKNKQRFKASYKYALEYNSKLDKIKNFLEDYFVANNLNNIMIDKDKLKDSLHCFLEGKNKLKISVNKTFFEYFDAYILDSKTGRRQTITGRPVKQSTLKTYVTTLNHLKKFVDSYKYDLTFDTINEEFIANFTKYLIKKKMSNNGQSYVIKVIKTFMHYTLSKELHSNTKFIKILKKNTNETTIIALDSVDLEKLEKLENLSARNCKIKDCFLAQIYSGLRYSDLVNLKPANINLVDKRITLYTIKTQEPLIIPIAKKLEEILIRYANKLPLCSNQKYNQYIKEVCKIAEINTPVQITKYIGNKRIDIEKPKYELISSHSARRTFITLTLKKGVLPEMVMKISGHRTRSSFQKYVRITQEEAVNQVQKVWDE